MKYKILLSYRAFSEVLVWEYSAYIYVPDLLIFLASECSASSQPRLDQATYSITQVKLSTN